MARLAMEWGSRYRGWERNQARMLHCGAAESRSPQTTAHRDTDPESLNRDTTVTPLFVLFAHEAKTLV